MMTAFKGQEKGIYVFGGDQADQVEAQWQAQILSPKYKLTPILYSSNLSANTRELVDLASKKFPTKGNKYTVATVNDGIDVTVF